MWFVCYVFILKETSPGGCGHILTISGYGSYRLSPTHYIADNVNWKAADF